METITLPVELPRRVLLKKFQEDQQQRIARGMEQRTLAEYVEDQLGAALLIEHQERYQVLRTR